SGEHKGCNGGKSHPTPTTAKARPAGHTMDIVLYLHLGQTQKLVVRPRVGPLHLPPDRQTPLLQVEGLRYWCTLAHHREFARCLLPGWERRHQLHSCLLPCPSALALHPNIVTEVRHWTLTAHGRGRLAAVLAQGYQRGVIGDPVLARELLAQGHLG